MSESDLGPTFTPPPPPRLTLLDPAALDEAQRDLYSRILGGPRGEQQSEVRLADEEGRLLGPFGIMLLAPSVGDAVQALGAAIRFQTSMSDRCRELAILTTAASLSSEFEWDAHVHAARSLGISEPQLEDLSQGRLPVGLAPVEEFTVGLVQTLASASELSDRDFNEANENLGHLGLSELVWLVGYYGALALALRVFGSPSSPPQNLQEPTGGYLDS